MRITVITACYNAADTVAETIESVLMQSHPDLEYIVIDGASTDDTMAQVEPYRNRITRLISEPDLGMYDAINKGIALATGEVIAILNGDDLYANPEVLAQVASAFKKHDTEAVYGDLVYVPRADPNEVTRFWRSGEYRRERFKYGWMPPHPAFFLRKRAYDQYGAFDLRLHSAADYELMLRMLYRHKLSAVWLPQTLVRMRTGGKSNSSVANRMAANREDAKAWRLNGLRALPFTFLLKPIRKLPQYILRPGS